MTEIPLKIREELANKLTFLQLCSSLMKEIASDYRIRQIKEMNLMLDDFLSNASDSEIITKGAYLLNLLEPLLNTAVSIYPPKKPINEIAKAYNEYSRAFPGHITQFGIYYGWLNEQIDCRKLYNEPIPSHAKVGTFFNAGKFIIEESILLRDAFFFLVIAQNEQEKLGQWARSHELVYRQLTTSDREKAAVLNSNVGTFCRMSLLNLYSFVEAFVNGIALDHLYNQSNNLTDREKELLTGKSKKNYLSLEAKLEKFHQIIRPDKNIVFVTTSKLQQKEPFFTFFSEFKEIRNSSVHYSPLKAGIILQPQVWIEKIKKYAENTLLVAKAFWEACYTDRKVPDYLDLLDYDILLKIAIDRFAGKAN